MKLLSELTQILKEMDELSCHECGEELKTREEFESGVCDKCASEEDCEYTECWVDKNNNILSEAAVRMFKRFGKEIKRRYRCTAGPKKGKPVSDPKKCATRKDPKKVRHGRKVARTKKGIRVRKSKIMGRTAMSKMVRRMNARLSGGRSQGSSNSPTSPSIAKPKKVFTQSSSTVKPVKLKKTK